MKRPLVSIVFVLVALAVGFLLTAHPWQVYKRQSGEAKGLDAQAIELERKRTELTRERDQLQDPLKKQEMARHGGWLKKGEQPIHPAP